MTIQNKLLAIGVSLFILAGCASGEKKGQQARYQAPPVPVEQSPARICQTVQENPVRANDSYLGKSITLDAQVRSIEEGYQPRYRIYLLATNVHIHATTQNLEQVRQLTVGQGARVSGVIENLAYKYDGCSITLKNAVF